MRRALPLAAVAVAVMGVATLQPGAETGACAQGGAVVPRADCESGSAEVTTATCGASTESFRAVRVRPVGRSLRLSFTRRVNRPVQMDVFQVSAGRQVLGQRLVARFTNRRGGVRWNGRAQRRRARVRDGAFFVRFRIRDARGRVDERRVALTRTRGRFRLRPDFYRRASCATLTSYKLERPVFGGRRSRALGIAFRLARAGTVTVEVRRAGRVVKRFGPTTRRARVTHRLRLTPERLRRGTYEIRLVYKGDQSSLAAPLYAQRL